jgi:hypothetical protein
MFDWKVKFSIHRRWHARVCGGSFIWIKPMKPKCINKIAKLMSWPGLVAMMYTLCHMKPPPHTLACHRLRMENFILFNPVTSYLSVAFVSLSSQEIEQSCICMLVTKPVPVPCVRCYFIKYIETIKKNVDIKFKYVRHVSGITFIGYDQCQNIRGQMILRARK